MCPYDLHDGTAESLAHAARTTSTAAALLRAKRHLMRSPELRTAPPTHYLSYVWNENAWAGHTWCVEHLPGYPRELPAAYADSVRRQTLTYVDTR